MACWQHAPTPFLSGEGKPMKTEGANWVLAVTPALRANSPVPGGEPEFQTDQLPQNYE